MKFIITTFTFLLITSASFSQATDSTAKANAVAQATKMAGLLLKKDYKAFCAYTYAPVLNLFGGADKMAVYIEKSIKEMDSQNFKMKEFSIENCSEIIHAGKQWQCTLTEVIILEHTGKKYRQRSALIGISDNKGVSWTFIDTHGAPLKELQEMLKELSDDLVIPEGTQPELIN